MGKGLTATSMTEAEKAAERRREHQAVLRRTYGDGPFSMWLADGQGVVIEIDSPNDRVKLNIEGSQMFAGAVMNSLAAAKKLGGFNSAKFVEDTRSIFAGVRHYGVTDEHITAISPGLLSMDHESVSCKICDKDGKTVYRR